MIGLQLADNDHLEHFSQYLSIRSWKWQSSSNGI